MFVLCVGYIIYSFGKEQNPVIGMIAVVQAIGVLFYYYGDNINNLLEHYGEELGCGSTCREDNRIAAVIFLGLALVSYQAFPMAMKKCAELSGYADNLNVTGWFTAADMIPVLLKIDALYTVVVTMAQTTEFCGTHDLGISIAFLCILFVVTLIVEITSLIYSCKIADDSNKLHTVFSVVVIFGLVAVMICFPLYLLADNMQPLDCAFNCDTFASNTTQNDVSCLQRANNGVRIGFTGVTFILILCYSLILCCCNEILEEEAHPI